MLRVDAARAEARSTRDRDMIFAAIKAHTFDGIASFDGLNAVIKRLLQGWIAARGKAICDDSNNVANLRTGSLRHAVALIAHQQTDYLMANEQFRLAVAVRSEVLGESEITPNLASRALVIGVVGSEE